MEKEFNLLVSNIIDLDLKLDGKLPVNRDELLALANTWGRNSSIYTLNKSNEDIFISFCEINKKYNLSKLDVSEITNFNSIFRATNFNGDISSWNVSKATSMDSMFCEAYYFNSPLEHWDISNVTSLAIMFYKAKKFNSPLNSWNISNVRTMAHMFAYTEEFNQPLDKWDTSNVISMIYMFYKTENFNQNLNSWNISKTTNMNFMFENAKVFNQHILWDLSKVNSCRGFINTQSFKNRFNRGNPLPYETDELKEWLINNRSLMVAIEIENNKRNDLNDFLLNIENVQIRLVE